MEAQAGLRVVRGPDWEWGDQDGGEGHVGTVVEVGQPSNEGIESVVVQWDCGERCKYRCGQDGKYDLRVLDSAPTGACFGPYSLCYGCMEDNMKGFGWKCIRCIHYTLCSYCYFSGVHLLDHQFARFITESTKSFVPLRSESTSVMATGLYPGARVKIGPDLKHEGIDKDAFGEILDSGSKSCPSVVSVKWDKTGERLKCRIGDVGKIDILCVQPAPWCCYYPDHLPCLGAPNCPPKYDEIMSGNYVQVQLDADVFKLMQNEDHGGWNDRMAMFVGRLGKVEHINDNGNLVVCYHGEHKKWVLNPDAVVKVEVPNIDPDEMIRVLDDGEKVMSFQLSAGVEWTQDMCDCLGKVGTIKGTDHSGVLTVVVDCKEYLLSPFCVSPEGIKQEEGKVQEDPELVLKVHSLLAEGNPAVLAYAAKLGDEHVIREYLKNYPNEVNSKVEGKTPILWAIQESNVSALKCLLDHHADANSLDEFCQPPLDYCIRYSTFIKSSEIAKLLLDCGADPNMKGADGLTMVHKAIVARDMRSLKVLVNHPKTDFYVQDDDGETALHRAVLNRQETPVKLLLDAGADPTRLNKEMLSALHVACATGNTVALKEILEHRPECINLKDKKGGCSPLVHCILQQQHHTAAYLLRQPHCDVNTKTDINRTALHGAVIKGDARMVELLVGYGADMNIQDHEMATPLHIITHLTGKNLGDLGLGLSESLSPDLLKELLPGGALGMLKDTNIADFKISESTPRLQEIQQIVGRDVNAQAVIACFLIREGADFKLKNILAQSPLEGCTDPVLATVIATFAEEHAGKGTFHGSLRNHPQVAVVNRVAPVAIARSSSHVHEESSSSKKNESTNRSTVRLPGPKVDHSEVDNEASPKLCELCEEEPANVKFLPCGHKVLCSLCALRAVKCLVCKKQVTKKEESH